MSEIIEMNERNIDIFKEIGNIGAGNAATSLASMLNREIEINIPVVSLLRFDEVSDILGGPENLMAGILIEVFGDVKGTMMFLLEQQFVCEIISTLVGDKQETLLEMSELNISAVQEVGNILAASYLNSIAMLTGLAINISPPAICIDMVGSILSVPAIQYGDIGNQALTIEGLFVRKDSHVDTNLILILEQESLELILTRLGVVYE